MKTLVKFITLIVLALSLVACTRHPDPDTVNLKKDGTEYKIGEEISFYYPVDFQLDISQDDNTRINFIRDEEGLFYTSYQNKTDNVLEDLDELYVAELEESGARNIEVTKPVIDSGLTSFEIVGENVEVGTKFKHLVYFTDGYTYIYGYVATSSVYDENIKTITEYLESIVINYQKVNK